MVVVLTACLLVVGYRPPPASARGEPARIAFLEGRLHKCDAKIAKAERMKAAIERNPRAFRDVPQTLQVLNNTLKMLREAKATLEAKLEAELPLAASDEQVQAMIDKLKPFLEQKREPDARCPDSSCSCPDKKGKPVCGVPCTGTCYKSDGDSEGGIDCSHLLARSARAWQKAYDLPWACPGHADPCDDKVKTQCPDLPNPPNQCGHGTEFQLQLLKNKKADDLHDASDFRAGDAVFFERRKTGRIEHVVLAAQDPSCETDASGAEICKLQIINAPHAGSQVRKSELILTNGCYCPPGAMTKDGKCPRAQCIAGGGTLP